MDVKDFNFDLPQELIAQDPDVYKRQVPGYSKRACTGQECHHR